MECTYQILASYAGATQGNLQLSPHKYYWLDNTRRHFFSQVIKQLVSLLETYSPHNALSTIFSSNAYYHIRTIIGRNAKLI